MALVAQRLKRMTSIAHKLERFPDMKLSQMHDLGGCRAVLASVSKVDTLVDTYRRSDAKNPNNRAELVKSYDYVKEPKADGYRSVHLVYKYRSRAEKHSIYNGLRIEIQARSRLQHAWATAVETVDAFTGQALKSNIGDESWKRFFALMGSAIAIDERRPLVLHTPLRKKDLMDELRSLCEALKVEDILDGLRAGIRLTTDPKAASAKTYIMVLDTAKKDITVFGYTAHDFDRATTDYMQREKANAGDPSIQTVLVSVDSLVALRRAYPNYYLDTSAFMALVRRTIGRKCACPLG